MLLSERVERLERPDREVDAEIVVALDLRPDWLKQAVGEMWVAQDAGIGQPVIRWRDDRMARSEGNPPTGDYIAPTASLDAAMSLGRDDWERADALINALQMLGNPDYLQGGSWSKLLPLKVVANLLKARGL